MPGLGIMEMIVIGAIAVLLFGKRLPEVARTVGKSYYKFRKGLGDLQSDVGFDPQSMFSADDYSTESNSSSGGYQEDVDDLDEATAPKFEPPPSEPTDESDQ